MKPLNILFLGGAKRVSMARHFKAAGKKLGLEVGIVSYEAELDVPIAIEGEVVIGKRWSDPDVASDIRCVMREKKCSIVVPFVDGAVAVAANVAAGQNDIFAPCSSAELSQSMFDKVLAAGQFSKAGIPIPRTYAAGDSFPLIAKPRNGSASKGIMKISDEASLSALENPQDFIIQEFIENAEEYTVDCYVSALTGEICAVVPRVRLAVESGEVVRTMTVDNPVLVALSRRVLTALGFRGAVTLQFICDKTHPERMLLMEINPRLGGGAVCAIHAGANLAWMIISESAGIPATPTAYRPLTEIFRYRSEVVFYK